MLVVLFSLHVDVETTFKRIDCTVLAASESVHLDASACCVALMRIYVRGIYDSHCES